MKTRYKVLICLGSILLISIAGCKKDFLEHNPIGTLSEQTLETKDGINKLLIGAYYNLRGDVTNWIYGNNSNWTFSNNASHEMVRGATSNSDLGSFERMINMNAQNQEIGYKWRGNYDGIQRANDVLRLLAKMPSGVLTDNESLQIKAEATFLRAILHFELIRTWLHVPYVDENVSLESGNYILPNTTLIWPQIEADMKFAADNLTPLKNEIGRVNKWAARAFLAKIYMYEHKYAEALPLLTDVINNGTTPKGEKYALNVKFFDNFDASMKNSNESVFAIQYSVQDGAGGKNANYGMMMTLPLTDYTRGGGSSNVGYDLMNTFRTDSVTGLPLFEHYNDFNVQEDVADPPHSMYAGTLDPRLDNTVIRYGIPALDWGLCNWDFIPAPATRGPAEQKKEFFSQSQVGIYTESIGWQEATADNYNMMRFADILLLAAECEVEVGSLTQAEIYVNMIRSRAADPIGWVKTYINDNNPSLGFTNTPAANYKISLYTGQFASLGKEFARKAVHFERRLELALEGHRFFDLARWDNGTGSMADELNAIVAHENSCPSTFPNLKGAIFTKGKNEIYPIPQLEIDLSAINGKSVLVQNPGY